jgi:hypothetical protein
MRVLLTERAEVQFQKFTAAERRRIMRRLGRAAKTASEGAARAVGEEPRRAVRSSVIVDDLAVVDVVMTPGGLFVTRVQRRSP